jgi:hypothetical protein
MALKKISELNPASSADVTSDDSIIINDGSTTKRVSLSNLISGSDAEVRGLFSASGDLSYDSAAGEFSFTERSDAEVRGLFSASGDLSYDSAAGVFSVTVPPGYDSSDFDTDFSGKSTSDLSEGTNLYYTDARVDSHLSGGTGVSYSSGTISIGQSVGTTDNVTFNNVNVSGTLSSDDISAATVTASNDLVVQGNLTVQGTTTTTNSTEINTESATITLVEGLDENTAPSQNAGLIVNRGSSPDKTFLFDEGVDKWTIGTETLIAGTVEADVTGTVSDISNHDTDDLSEGASNLYFTTARIDNHLSGGNAIDYNSGTISVASDAIGTDELNVAGTGSAGEALLSDGDGSFSFGPAGATITDDSSTDSSFYPTLSDSTSGSFTAATVSSSKLFFNPSSGTLNATTFNSLSDERTKKNVHTLHSIPSRTPRSIRLV